MDENLSTAAADKLLRDAGYDPDLVRGRKTAADFQRESDADRRKRWTAKNRLEGEGRQRGLVKPVKHAVSSDHGNGSAGVGAFVVGYLFSKLF